MPEPQIFIGAVLVIVVIHDRYANPWQSQVLKDVHRDTPAERRRDDRRTLRCVLDHLHQRLRNRQVHGRARSAVSAFIDHFRDARMRK